ncbi:MAG: 5-(carboxyamino)imidazole ribonucleotide synthase [Litorivicinus sp.]
MTKRIGVVGGGQLARMLQPEVTALGATLTVLDPDAHAPACANADANVLGGYHDEKAIFELASRVDVITVELEDVGVEALARVRDAGTPVYPAPELIALIRDKLTQKQAYERLGIPTAPFVEVAPDDPQAFDNFGYPLVQKTRTGGYDGRGVVVMDSSADYANRLDAPSFVEAKVDARMELAVMVARGPNGECAVFEPVEMVVDPDLNLLDLLLTPARISDELRDSAKALAERVITELEGVGLFGVELFVTHEDALLVNEIAPRAHNSGHHSIEACQTSQFGQQARLLLGLPLGTTDQPKPAALVNLIGAPGFQGETVAEGLADALAIPGVTVHLYGKTECRPGRKMGHFSVVAETVTDVLANARAAKRALSIKGKQAL